MFNPNFIRIYDNALTSYQCKEIIKWTENQDLIRGGLLNKNISLKDKNSWDIPYEKTTFSNKTFIDLMIYDSLGKGISNYRESYPEIDSIASWRIDDGFHIQKYNPGGGFFTLHCENGGETSIKRVLAWMIYLNTVTDKGGTYFSSYNKTIRAKEGRLVIWPAYFTHHHKGVVSKTQTKYIATGWYSFTNVVIEEA
mgnify:CR=1 FL=1|tara:strand:- start:86 stop:673 length:588 start_codon:yes stop_codon:yes gene_type:complete